MRCAVAVVAVALEPFSSGCSQTMEGRKGGMGRLGMGGLGLRTYHDCLSSATSMKKSRPGLYQSWNRWVL